MPRAVLDAGGGVEDEFSRGPQQVPYWALCNFHRDQGPVELRMPSGWIVVQLRTRDVALPKVGARFVPVGHDPSFELAPGSTKAVVITVIYRPRYGRGGKLARFHAANRGHPCRDG